MENFGKYLKSKLKGSKKTENLVVIIVLCVILLVAVNYIFNEENELSKETVSDNVKYINEVEDNLETKLEETLNAISGVSNAKVVISYTSTETINPIYDIKEDINVEGSGDKKTTTEKTVAYEEAGGDKVAIVASKNLAKAEGAVVVFDGNGDLEATSKVKESVAVALDISLHKIQVIQN